MIAVGGVIAIGDIVYTADRWQKSTSSSPGSADARLVPGLRFKSGFDGRRGLRAE